MSDWTRRVTDWVRGGRPEEALAGWNPDPDDPVEVAWHKVVFARPIPPHPRIFDGCRVAVSTRRFAPKLRGTEAVARRVATLVLCSEAVDALARGDVAAHTRVVEHPLFLGEQGPFGFEHPEAHLLRAVAEGGPLERAYVAQLSWRGQSALALAWALQWLDDATFADAVERDDERDRVLAVLPPDEAALSARIASTVPRPLDAIRGALAQARVAITSASPGTATHSVNIERIKSLRWMTEPWWPELALTPWDDRGAPRPLVSPEAWREQAMAFLKERS